MKNPLLEKWEGKLQTIFDGIDAHLQEKYGEMFPLSPSRKPSGQGISRDCDGLFDLGFSFTAGLTSKLGPGYVFKVKMATPSRVPREFTNTIENEVVELLREKLPEEFPGRDLKVGRDGRLYKIYGDLDLN